MNILKKRAELKRENIFFLGISPHIVHFLDYGGRNSSFNSHPLSNEV
jgi:hypothetical protein